MRRRVPGQRTIGLGATVVYTNPETGYHAWDVPGWCQYVSAFAINTFGIDACKPPTPGQIAETTKSNMGAAAANNPAVAQQIDTIANASPTDPYYCQADPEGCAAYGAAITNPSWCTSIFGAGSTGQAVCGASFPGISNVWMIATGVLLAFLVLRR